MDGQTYGRRKRFLDPLPPSATQVNTICDDLSWEIPIAVDNSVYPDLVAGGKELILRPIVKEFLHHTVLRHLSLVVIDCKYRNVLWILLDVALSLLVVKRSP